MKKPFVLLIVALTTALPFTFASDPNPINEEVKTAFKKDFPGAELISWSQASGLVKAIFLFSGYRSEAYFTEEGELQGSVRNIFFNQAPLAVTRAVASKIKGAYVLEVSEITMNSSTSYMIRLEGQGKKYKLHIDANGQIISTEKSKA